VNIKTSQVRCMYDRLLVRPIFEDKTRAGLIVPEKHKASVPFFLARVESAGHGRVTEDNKVVPLLVKVGQVVMVERKAGLPMPIEGETLMMISEMHVLAIIDDYQEPSSIITAVA
jgi:co-chaperonin GroES (HSP10)